MRFWIDETPTPGIETGRAYNHGQHVCHKGHEECSDRAGGKCVDDVVFLCRVCRGRLIGSEIGHGICGYDASSETARLEIARKLGR